MAMQDGIRDGTKHLLYQLCHYVCNEHREAVLSLSGPHVADDYPDRLPESLEQFASDPLSYPLVLLENDELMAFLNARLLEPRNSPDERVVFFEAVRVRNTDTRRGLGTKLVQFSMDAIERLEPPAKRTRFLAATIDGNEAMFRVCEKCGWHIHREFYTFPGYTAWYPLVEGKHKLLDGLNVRRLVSAEAYQRLDDWTRVRDGDELRMLLTERQRSHGHDFRIVRVCVETYAKAATFLDEDAMRGEQGRAVWKLDLSGGQPPILVFLRPPSEDPVMPSLGSWDAAVVGCDGRHVDFCALLADREVGDGIFSMYFDYKMTANGVAQAKLMGNGFAFKFFVYEAMRST